MTEERFRAIAGIIADHAELGNRRIGHCGTYSRTHLVAAIRVSDAAIAELLVEISRLKDLASEAVAQCDQCDDGYIEIYLGDTHIGAMTENQPCPYCGPALRALNGSFYEQTSHSPRLAPSDQPGE